MVPAVADSRSRPALAWMVALGVFVCLSAAGIRYGPSPISGDETEYYATTYAWATNHSPELTPAVAGAIRAAIPGRPSTEPAMARAVDGSYHAIHFWFLSLLAAPFFALCRAAGLDWKHSFVFLNALMFAAVAGVAYRWFRWFGALILTAGLLVSPLVPYLNKAHGEAYSVSLAALAAMSLATRRRLAAALALSAIAVQVTAFSPLALLALGLWAVGQWRARPRPAARQWAAAGACAALLALQPLWTLWRYHELNLIVSEGFVFPEMATPHRMASLLLDPDVGFFFVWPLSVLLVGWIAASWIREPALLRRGREYWAFVAVLVAVIAFIGAEQMNYTTSAPRYSLWFIPFVLVGFVAVSHARRDRTAAAAICFVLAAAANGWYLYQAAGIVPKLERKPLAELWYRYLPGVWNPEEQVFADVSLGEQLESGRDLFFKRRFPIDVLLDRRRWAISNKDCTKLLVFGYAFTSSHVEPLAPLGCEAPVDARRMLWYVRSKGGSGMEDRYVATRPAANVSVPGDASDAAPDRPPRVLGHDVTEKGDRAVYTFRFSDPDGWQNLDTATMMIAGPRAACYIVYDQPRHELKVMGENGILSKAVVPGRSGALQSRWCTVDSRGASISAGGDTLAVKLPIALDPALRASGATVRAAVTDLDQPDPPDAPRVTFEPVAGASDMVRIGFAYEGPHSRDMARIWVLINDKRSEENACYFEYEPPDAVLHLVPDNGDGAKAPEMRLGEGRALENGRCIVDGPSSIAAGNRDRMELRLSVIRTGLFRAAKRVWVRYQESDGRLSDWRETALWRGEGDVPSPAAMLQPDARGDLLDVRFNYGGSARADVARMWVLINYSLDAAGSCYLTYEPADGAVYLNAAGAGGAVGRMRLAEGRSLENPQCRVDGRDSSVQVDANNFDLRLRVTRKSAFRGPKRVWAADQKNTGGRQEGKVSPWVMAGTWR